MTRHLTWLAALMASSLLAAQTPIVGEWHGVLATPMARLTMLVTIRQDVAGKHGGDLENLNQNTGRKIPLADVTVSPERLTFTIPSINATYEGSWKEADKTWSGVFRQGMTLPLVLVRGAPPALPVIDGLDGTWRATLQREAAALRLILRVRTTPRGTMVVLDSPDAGALGLNVERFVRTDDTVRFHVPISQVDFSGTLRDGLRALGGSWKRPGQPDAQIVFARDSTGPAVRVRTQWPIVPRGYRAESVSYGNPDARGVTLAGTLTIPEGPGPFPAVVLISGSAAQDRDETIFGHKPFAVLADHLSRRGIAVLRYDDRGFGASTGDHASATSADFATDANAGIRYLLSRPEIDGARIGFAGHSEGGMIGPIAAATNDRVAFLVLLAGPGTSTERVMLSQRRLMGVTQGVSMEDLDRTEPIARNIMRAVRAAPDSQRAVAQIRAVLTSEALQVLGATAGERDAIADQYTGPWMRYFLKYEPATFLARIEVPVLALNGSMDRQVASAENLAAIKVALAGNRDATVKELPWLNHMFQTARTGGLGEYADIAETFAPSAMDAISDWIIARFVLRPRTPAGIVR